MANNEWKSTTIGDLLDAGHAVIQTGPFGSQLHSYDYQPVGVPVVPTEAIGHRRLIQREIPRILPEKADELARHTLKPGDILFARRGVQATGYSAIVEVRHEGWLCGTGAILLRLKSPDIDPTFMSFVLADQTSIDWLKAHAVGAVMPNLNESVLRMFPFRLPPIKLQKRIASILGALDDKIELNRQTSETLQATVKALFQSWFVDFDPVRCKAAGRKAKGVDNRTAAFFPDAFEESSLGLIPQGWSVGVLNELAKLIIGGDWGASEPTVEECEPTLCIRGADIPSLQDGGLGKMPTRYLKTSSLNKRVLTEGDLAVEISGGSPTQSTGRAVFVSGGLLRSLAHPLVCSNFCRIVKLKSPEMSKAIYLWLRYIYDRGELLQFENGTTGIKNLAFTIFSEKYPLVIPPLDVFKAFDALVSPLFSRHQTIGIESRELAATRDALLPKMLSGELKIKEA